MILTDQYGFIHEQIINFIILSVDNFGYAIWFGKR